MTWHEGEDAARIPLTGEAFLDLLRRHFSNADSVYVAPHIPASKEQTARRTYSAHLPPHEDLLALYEARRGGTFDAVVREGFVLTSKRVCWKNDGRPAFSVEWSELDADRLLLDPEGNRLFLGEEPDEAIVVVEPEVQDACADAFHILTLSSRLDYRTTMPDIGETESGVIPRFVGSTHARTVTEHSPPPETTFGAYASHAQAQGPDFACWHCETPLYETARQCMFCGAEPASRGWLRTG